MKQKSWGTEIRYRETAGALVYQYRNGFIQAMREGNRSRIFLTSESSATPRTSRTVPLVILRDPVGSRPFSQCAGSCGGVSAPFPAAARSGWDALAGLRPNRNSDRSKRRSPRAQPRLPQTSAVAISPAIPALLRTGSGKGRALTRRCNDEQEKLFQQFLEWEKERRLNANADQ